MIASTVEEIHSCARFMCEVSGENKDMATVVVEPLSYQLVANMLNIAGILLDSKLSRVTAIALGMAGRRDKGQRL